LEMNYQIWVQYWNQHRNAFWYSNIAT
jgi:hypothetical protein